jgi:predicted GIY-YIG superfamily endonuclease
MWYVYVIRSTTSPEQEYTGTTADLKLRLADHNRCKIRSHRKSSLHGR